MFAFILRRLAVAIPTLLLLIVFSFVLMQIAPGGPFTGERALPPAVLANLEAQYGLNDPLWLQIWNYLVNVVVHFDFGPSFVYPDRTVNQLIASGFPVTLTYGGLSFVAAVVVGVSIGAQVLPNFVMAPLLVLVLTLWYGLLPGGGWSFSNPSFWIMPVIALSTSYMASIARITRSSMLEVLGSNHIRTARAKGMPEHRVIIRHALKPAMLPVISYLGPVFVSMITGSVVIDIYFSTGGIGKAFVDSALNRDYAVMMGVTILVGALTILFNLIVDVLYAWIDPKIRY